VKGGQANKQGMHRFVSACPHDASGCTRLDDEDQSDKAWPAWLGHSSQEESAKIFASILLGALEHELAKGPCEQDNVRVFRDGRSIFKSGMHGKSVLKVLHGMMLMLAATAQFPDEQKRRIFSDHQSYLGKKSAAKRLVPVEAWRHYVIDRGNAIWAKFKSYKADRIAAEILKEKAPVGISVPGLRRVADLLREK
jgi:hypothetical protein